MSRSAGVQILLLCTYHSRLVAEFLNIILPKMPVAGVIQGLNIRGRLYFADGYKTRLSLFRLQVTAPCSETYVFNCC
jgi:hypothetical protein